MNTCSFHARIPIFRFAFAFSLLSVFSLPFLHAAKLTAIQEALDIASSSRITIVEQRYIKYKTDEYGWIEEDAAGNPLTTTDSTSEGQSKWTVQSSKEKGTSPYYGKSCIRSSVSAELSPSNDALKMQLVCKVSGPGVFSFAYKTSTTDFSDGLVVYVDGEEVVSLCSGYYTDEFDLTTFVTTYYPTEWETMEIEIPTGKADGGRYEGTHDHEIIFEFFKDEPNYEYNEKDKLVYASDDGPIKPDVRDYDGSSDPVYKEDLAAYNAQKALFYNCIWLDQFQFMAVEPSLTFLDDELSEEIFIDQASILLDSNAKDFGYYIKYTTDGTTPKASSADYLFYDDIVTEDAIDVTESTVVKAKLFSTNTTAYSPEILISAQVTIKASAPKIVIDTEKSLPDRITLTMNTDFDGNIIHYTTDGSTPTIESPVYNADTGLVITKPCTVNAIAMRDNVLDSDVTSFTVEQAEPPQITVKNQKGQTPADFVFTAKDKLTVSISTTDNTPVLYQINDQPETVYTTEFTIDDPAPSSSCVITVRTYSAEKLVSQPISLSVYWANQTWVCTTKPGWNFITFPLKMTQTSIDNIFWLLGDNVFAFNETNRSYCKVSTLEQGQAYWFFIRSTPIPFSLKGASVPRQDTTIPSRKWTAYGAIEDEAIPADITAWHYDGKRFKPAGSFQKGKAYFIFKP